MSTPSDLTVLSQMFKNARQEDLAAVLAKEDNLDNTICSIRIATDQREPASWPQMIRRLAEGKHVWFIRPIGDGTKDSKPPPLTPPTPDVPTADSAHSKASGGKGHGGGTEPKAPLPASAAALRADADEVRAIFALGDVTVDDSMTDLQLAELLPLLQPVQLIDIDIEAPPNKAPSSAAVLVRNSPTDNPVVDGEASADLAVDGVTDVEMAELLPLVQLEPVVEDHTEPPQNNSPSA